MTATAESSLTPPSSARSRIPNLLTLARLFFSLAFFVILEIYSYPAGSASLLDAAVAIFIVAALTDAFDGYLARKWKVTSTFGRIMDPMCDKLLVIGAFIYLASPAFFDATLHQSISPDLDQTTASSLGLASSRQVSGVAPWMVALILARELLVTSIRGFAESAGIAFGAVAVGKAKMILQSAVIPILLVLIAHADPTHHQWSAWVRDISVSLTILVTVASAWPYISTAVSSLGALPRSTSS